MVGGGPRFPKCGCTLCKLKLVQAIRGTPQTSRRVLDLDTAELVWMLRAYHGADEIRDPHDSRASAQSTARRFKRGAPGYPDSSDLWPGKKATDRPVTVQSCVEPVAKYSSFVEKFVNGPRAASPVPMPSAPGLPLFVRQILSGGSPVGDAQSVRRSPSGFTENVGRVRARDGT